jgi:predicted dehydrogenase
MREPLTWGILGTGNIARQFAEGVKGAARSRIVAVASRDAERAAAFAKSYGAAAAYGNYEALLKDSGVSAVYVALPNNLHHEWTIRALKAGKHVLCEKPLAMNTAEAEEMFDASRRAGRLLVEAFMYRSHPLTHAVLQQVRQGAIGQVKLVRTSFCYRTSRVEGNIRFSPELGGGSLMDVGCYAIDFARLVAGGEPIAVHGAGHLHNGGVDDYAAGMLVFPKRQSDRATERPSYEATEEAARKPEAWSLEPSLLATFTCGMTVQAPNAAYICGDEGYIEVPVPWKPPQRGATYLLGHAIPPRMDVVPPSPGKPPVAPQDRQTFTVDAPVPLYALEADDFAAAVLDGTPPRMTPQDSLGNMRVLDELRRQVVHAG